MRKVAPGDHVIISFPWCGACPNCRRHAQPIVSTARMLKSSGTPRRRLDADVPRRRSGLQRVLPAVLVRAPMRSPMSASSSRSGGRAARPARAVRLQHPDRRRRGAQRRCGRSRATVVAVFGVGAVGLSGLMAAKIAGCDPIIAVDVHDSRLALARELGATHTLQSPRSHRRVAEIRASPAAARASRWRPRRCPPCSARRSRR